MKVDLDEIIRELDRLVEVSIYLPAQIDTKSLMDLCLELKAAREVMKYTRAGCTCGVDSYDGYLGPIQHSSNCKSYIDAVNKYNEATK